MSPSTLCEGGGGAYLYHPQCVSLGSIYNIHHSVSPSELEEGLVYIIHSVFPLLLVKVGEGLICIIHSVSPSTLCEGGGGAYLYHP